MVALLIALQSALARRAARRLWQKFSRSHPRLVPPDAVVTVMYTEFGQVLFSNRSWCHMRAGERCTAGRIPGAMVGVDLKSIPTYGTRPYDRVASVRTNFDRLTQSRRARIAPAHFDVVQDPSTKNVYIAFRRKASMAVNLVGFEVQGRYDPVTLVWHGPVGSTIDGGASRSGVDGGGGSGGGGGDSKGRGGDGLGGSAHGADGDGGGGTGDVALKSHAILDANGKFIIGSDTVARVVRISLVH